MAEEPAGAQATHEQDRSTRKDGDAPALSADASVDEVLDALDARGRTLRGFVANVRLTETDESTALSSTRAGKIWYQNKGGNDVRLRVVFDKKEQGRSAFDEKIEYILDDGWLLDRDYDKRIQVKRQVVAPGEKINLLKLGEGPFPMPIGQKKEDVHAQFDVEKVASGKDDPADTAHLRLVPKSETRLAKKVGTIDVWVDSVTQMPSRIEVLDANETTVRTTDFNELEVNPVLDDAEFTPPAIDEGEWDLHDEPFAE